jgi:hypothetical protein
MKKKLKKILTLLTCLFLFNVINTNLYADDFHDFDSMDIDFDLLDDYQSNNVPTRAASDIYDRLLDVIALVDEPLWNKTKPPKGRDTLYLIPHRISSLEYGGLIANFFFNYTPNMGFSIDEVLRLDENGQALDLLTLELIENLNAQEASSLIPLFKKLTIQERKIGALIQLGFILNSFRLELDSSLQFSERNFWLSNADQARIKEMFSGTDSTFDDSELYKYKFGMGDTRIKLGLNTLNTSNFQLDVGLEGIIPTSKISTGARFKQYVIDLDNLKDDIPDILRSIRDNLLTPQLGNFGHFGLGCYFESKIDLFHNNFHIWNRLSFDNLFSAKEDRLIPSKKTFDGFVDVATGSDEEKTLFIKEFILPPSYRVKIEPGDIVNFVTTLSFDFNKNSRFSIGYDYYYQQKEHFETVYTIENLNSLDLNAAISESASQHKIFAETNYTKKQRSWDLILGLGGDYTISNENLGYDWTIFLRVGAAF